MFITESEVVRFSGLDAEFPVDKISPFLSITEKKELKKLFGVDFRTALIADLKVDSAVYTKWVPTVAYLENATVVHLGLRWIAENNNTNKTPGTSVDWSLYEIFTSSEYQDLWNMYLRNYLAFACALPALTFATIKATGNGLMIQAADDKSRNYTATKDMQAIFKSEMINQMNNIADEMKDWVIEAHAEYDDPNDSLFKSVAYVSVLCRDSTSSRPRTRIHWPN